MWKTTSAEELVGDSIRAWTQSQRFKPGTSTHSFPSADGGERQWSSVQSKQAHQLRLRSGPWPSVNTTQPHTDSHWRSTSSSGPPGGRKHHADFLPSFLVDAALIQAAADDVQHLITQTVLFLKELTSVVLSCSSGMDCKTLHLWKTLKLFIFGQIQCDVTTRLISASWSHFILMASQKCFLRPPCVFIPVSEEEGGVFFCCSKLVLDNHRQQVIPSDQPNAWRRINQPQESIQNYNLRHRFPIRTGWMCLDEITGETQNNIHWIQNVPPLIYRNMSTWVGVQSGGLRLTGSRKHSEISVRRDTHWAIKSSLFSA